MVFGRQCDSGKYDGYRCRDSFNFANRSHHYGLCCYLQMGVSSTVISQKLLHGCPVARWLWESHCREEWCGVYSSGVYCFAPLTTDPCLTLGK